MPVKPRLKCDQPKLYPVESSPMQRYRSIPYEVEAVKITDAMFDDTHPNPLHVTGVTYDQKERCVWAGFKAGKIGDYLILQGGLRDILPADAFYASYEPIEGEEA